MKKKFLFFLSIMVKNILKLTIQKDKNEYFGFKYSKTAVKNAVTLIFAATLIIAPIVYRKILMYMGQLF